MARPLRSTPAALTGALLVLALLLGACGGGGDGDDAATERTTEETRPTLVAEPCALLTYAQLDAVTGLHFDAQVERPNQCTYTSSEALSAIALNVFTTGGRSAAEVVAQATGECDEGSVSTIDSPEVAGGYGCLVAGVVTVAVVTHDDLHYILTGSTQQEGAQSDLLLQQLSQLLAEAVLG